MPLWGIKFKPADDGGVASRGGRQTAGSGPHPLPSPADGRGPALESHLGTRSHRAVSVSAERPWGSLRCNMSPPRLPPQVESLLPSPGQVPKTCGLVALGHHIALCFQGLLPPPEEPPGTPA